MTPRPSDEAREALRAARERARRGPVPSGTPDHPHTGAEPSANRASDQPAAGAEATPGPTSDRPASSGQSATAPAPRPADKPRPADESRRADESRPADDSRPARRPGDIAREALRSARAEALRTRAEADDRPPRTRPAPPAPRLPRTTRGDRAADDRARAVRAALADAFRMPDAADDPQRGPAPADRPRRTATSRTTTPQAPAPPNTRPGQGTSGPPAPHTPAPDPAARRDLSGPAHRDPAHTPRDGVRDSTSDPGDPAHTPRDGVRDSTHDPGDPAHSQAALGPAHAPAPVPHAPRSMAAPGRDGDHRRTFPAFPPRPSDGEGFAETWWGRAWVTALEDGALDAARLARGRGYAEQGHVDAITVTPGLVLAYVRGSRPRPYRVQVRLRTFGDADWERFLDAAAERPGHIAALLDKEMPQSLADCGVPLLPGPGDLDPRCSCPDSGHPCKHAAALCYQTARLLDADPFVLLLLRGRGEREVIDALSRLSAARAARAARDRDPEPLPGVRAAEVLARRDRVLPPLPAPLPPPPHPEQPPVYPASPGGPDPFALDQLATDAAARAHALLTTGRDPVGGLTLWHDAVRLAAARPGSGLTAATRALYSSLATAVGRTPAELARAVAAWRQGGRTGLAVLEEPWDPPAGRFDRARPLLLAADLPAFRPWRNRLTHPRGHVQLRLGRDNLWYAYESEPGHDDWWPRGTPDPDPVGALTGLDSPDDL